MTWKLGVLPPGRSDAVVMRQPLEGLLHRHGGARPAFLKSASVKFSCTLAGHCALVASLKLN